MKNSNHSFSKKYLPRTLSRSDTKKQLKMLIRTQKLYKKRKFYTRKKIASFKSKKSSHIANACKIYGVKSVNPNRNLAIKTGCSLHALKQIVKKGEGAYYSSGSRPNQTAKSWGLARLASAITSGKAAKVDYKILEEGCNHKKKAFMLAIKSINKHKMKVE